MAKAKSSTKSKTVTKKTAKKPVKAVVKEKIKKVVPKSTESEEDQLAVTIEKKLIVLYTLQQIESQIDKIRIIRGELPLEVQDLEDEIAGLETRIENFVLEIEEFEKKSINEEMDKLYDAYETSDEKGIVLAKISELKKELHKKKKKPNDGR